MYNWVLTTLSVTESRSQAWVSLDPSLVDGGAERSVVVVVLIGVGLGELDERAVEAVALAEVRRDRDAVAAARVRTRQRPAAEFAVRGQAARDHPLDLRRSLPVLQ